MKIIELLFKIKEFNFIDASIFLAINPLAGFFAFGFDSIRDVIAASENALAELDICVIDEHQLILEAELEALEVRNDLR